MQFSSGHALCLPTLPWLQWVASVPSISVVYTCLPLSKRNLLLGSWAPQQPLPKADSVHSGLSSQSPAPGCRWGPEAAIAGIPNSHAYRDKRMVRVTRVYVKMELWGPQQIGDLDLPCKGLCYSALLFICLTKIDPRWKIFLLYDVTQMGDICCQLNG